MFAYVVAISTAMILWVSVCIVVSSLSLFRMVPSYRDFRQMTEFERRSMVLVPSLLIFAYWTDYQRVNAVVNMVTHTWSVLPTPLTAIHLTLATAASSGIMWVVLCSAMGHDLGHSFWKRLVSAGIVLSMIVASAVWA